MKLSQIVFGENTPLIFSDEKLFHGEQEVSSMEFLELYKKYTDAETMEFLFTAQPGITYTVKGDKYMAKSSLIFGDGSERSAEITISKDGQHVIKCSGDITPEQVAETMSELMVVYGDTVAGIALAA